MHMYHVVHKKYGPFMKHPKQNLIFPVFFVVLYGSGFVGTQYGLQYANTLSFLSQRFMIAALILGIFCLAFSKTRHYSLKEIVHIIIAGSLTVATFSIGVFASIEMGLSASLSAMITSLQPLLVGFIASKLMNERLSSLQWLGLTIGLVGVTMVLARHVDTSGLSVSAVLMSVMALFGLTIGNVYQKRFCQNMDLFFGGAIQSLSAALICLILLASFSEYKVQWTADYIYALAYMTIGVSVGALSLLYVMIRYGSVSKVASLFYLMPITAACVAFIIFGERLDGFTLSGFGVVITGIILTTRSAQ